MKVELTLALPGREGEKRHVTVFVSHVAAYWETEIGVEARPGIEASGPSQLYRFTGDVTALPVTRILLTGVRDPIDVSESYEDVGRLFEEALEVFFEEDDEDAPDEDFEDEGEDTGGLRVVPQPTPPGAEELLKR